MKHRLMRVFFKNARDRARELDEEIETHLALREEEFTARGMSSRQARSEALARFGDLAAVKKDLSTASAVRDLKLGVSERIDDIRRDLTVAFRRARARPGHTLVSTAIFALGIGIVTVMFATTDNVLFRPLPFPEPEKLVSLQSVPQGGTPFQAVSMGNWYDWKTQSRTLKATAIYSEAEMDVSWGSEVSRIRVAVVAGSFFETLEIPVTPGRAFLESEAQEWMHLVVVSERFWQRALGGTPHLDDEILKVNGVDYQVVGVVPEGLEFPSRVDLWRPMQYQPESGMARNYIHWRSIGRLADGVTIDQAAAELSSIADGIRETDPAGVYSYGVGVEPLRRVVVGNTARNLLMLQGSVLLVLLIACTNLMGLEFAGARERQDEIAIRLSLGAARGRLLQQLVTEQVALAVLGGSVGLILAAWGTAFVAGRLSAVIPRAHEVAFDARILAVGFALSLLAGLIAGLGPAWRASRGDPGRVLTGVRTIRGGRGLPGGALVLTEVALTVLLLTGGGLLLRSMGMLVNRDLGFETEGVITLNVNLQTPRYLHDQNLVVSYWDALLATLEDIPGVRAVGAGNWIPTGGGGTTFIELPEVGRTLQGAGHRVISDTYLETMGAPLLGGRLFSIDDQAGSEQVVIVNETMARVFWPDGDPLGQRIKAEGMENFFFGGEAPWLTVIGVVGDMRHWGFESGIQPEMFRLYRQIPAMGRILTAVVKTEPGSVRSVMTEARERARTVDPDLAVQEGLLSDRLRDLMSERRLTTTILVAFGIISLGLASLGIYGVLAFAVSARTREMAIRTALGARRAGLVGLVVRSGLKVVALGLLAGAVGIFILQGVLDALLVDVGAGDPITVLVVFATITTTALAAALTPAVRAARMNPLEALRER